MPMEGTELGALSLSSEDSVCPAVCNELRASEVTADRPQSFLQCLLFPASPSGRSISSLFCRCWEGPGVFPCVLTGESHQLFLNGTSPALPEPTLPQEDTSPTLPNPCALPCTCS